MRKYLAIKCYDCNYVLAQHQKEIEDIKNNIDAFNNICNNYNINICCKAHLICFFESL